MKVRVTANFRDKRENVFRSTGEEFEATEERVREIEAAGNFVERIEDKPKRKTRASKA